MMKILPQPARLLLIYVVCLIAWLTPSAQAASTTTRTVCQTFCDFTTIQSAINASSDGDTVFVLTALHTEASIFVNKDVIIEGSGSENTTVQADTTPNSASDRIFQIDGSAIVTIRNMTLRNGQSGGGTLFVPDGGSGGAILNNGHLTVDSVHMTANATGDGFGCTFEGCVGGSGGGGGAIYNGTDGVLIVINALFSANQTGQGGDCTAQPFCEAGHGGHGGAIHNAGWLQIAKTSIYNNQTGEPGTCNASACVDPVADLGGGLYNGNGYVYLRNSTIGDNISADAAGIGARTGNRGADLVFRNVTITDNQLRNGTDGTGGVGTDGTTTVFNTIIADNEGTQCDGVQELSAEAINLSSDSSCIGFGYQDQSAELFPLGFHEGTHYVAPPEWDSLAFGTGHTCEISDQRGFRRTPKGGNCELGAYEKLETSACRSPNLAIPNGSANGVDDSLVIGDAGTVIDTRVAMTITHSYVGELSATLKRYNDGQVLLFDQPGAPPGGGCPGPNVDATFADGISRLAEFNCELSSPAIFGDFGPAHAMSFVDGLDSDGTWALNVTDHNSSTWDGTLDSWCVEFDYAPDVSADPLTQFTLSVSQQFIGLGDHFYLRVDVRTGSNGWSSADGDLFIVGPTVDDGNGGSLIPGTPIVPDGTNVVCSPLLNYFRCDGENDAALAANRTYTFYFPYQNPSDGSGCDAGGVINGELLDKTLTHLDLISLPRCISSSQGSTFPPSGATPTAIHLSDVNTAGGAVTPILFIVGLLFVTMTTLRRDRIGSVNNSRPAINRGATRRRTLKGADNFTT